jgi:hypothetical protein
MTSAGWLVVDTGATTAEQASDAVLGEVQKY